MDRLITTLTELKQKKMIGVKFDDIRLLVVLGASGDISALEDRCSHADVRLSKGRFDGTEIECPAHGARFDVRTGQALCMPAITPVQKFPVKIVEDEVFVVLPDDL